MLFFVSRVEEERLGISDSELTDHDYDVIQPVQQRTSPPKSRRPSQLHFLHRHYGLSRLNDNAKTVLDQCVEYQQQMTDWSPSKAVTPVTLTSATVDLPFDDEPVPLAEEAGESTGSAQHQRVSQGPASVNKVPVYLVLAFVVGYICVGATVFSAWEEWGVNFIYHFCHPDLLRRIKITLSMHYCFSRLICSLHNYDNSSCSSLMTGC